MKTFVERRLFQIRLFANMAGVAESTDIYYDDLAVERGEQFVVKIQAGDQVMHFRHKRLRLSLNEAAAWMFGLMYQAKK